MQSRVALVVAGLALVISILAMTSIGGAANGGSNLPSALVNSNDNGGGFVRNTGFQSVSSPDTGEYCLTLKAKSTEKRVAIVAAEEGLSAADDPAVRWDSTNPNCPDGTIEVDTYDDDNNLDDQVAFTIAIL